SSKIRILTSKDSVIAPIFYREVPLPFSFTLRNLDKVRWRLGDISKDSLAPVVMEKLPVCANCHTFSADGKTLAMDVDAHSGKDAYGIANIEKETILHRMIHWSNSQKDEPTYALLASASPNGRYFIATLKDNEFFVVQPDISYSQLFFPIKGILAVYDKFTDKYTPLPGADDTNYVQSNPSWSPKGDYILFTRSKAIPSEESGFITAFNRDSIKYQKLVDDFYHGKRQFKYDIYKIPFNDGRGGTAVPIEGASANGMSNYFPKVSPDGKWIVFTQAKNFMLLQPDSKLWIVPAEGGAARILKCNSSNMNSWHSWSPNSRWLVFSSKMRGTYTKLYLTHIDENGNDSPPICLENLCVPDRVSNLPEFVNVKPGEFDIIKPSFLNNDYFKFQDGIRKVEAGDLKGAIEDFTKAASIDSNNFMVFGSRGYTYYEMGDSRKAIEDFDKAISLKPNEAKLYNMRGFARKDLRDTAGAISDFKKAVELNPKDFESLNALGYLKAGQKNFSEAILYLTGAIKLHPQYFDAFYERGIARFNIGDFPNAIDDYSAAIKINPKFHFAYFHRGISYLAINKNENACADLRKALELGFKPAEKVISEYCR
ncbi:MAG: hypothetical protein QG635_742, partial [Bacteroidota bacterium]|nr:hypothetical protein [Bacteroidota bacterium]